MTLVKRFLPSILTYFLSLFNIPVLVAKSLEKLQKGFLVGGIRDEFKYHLVD